MDTADVVIVGGGIAGSALAFALAKEGLEVTVLEASVEYEDRVRGESMHAWGVAEARDIGVEDVLLDSGAHVAPVWRQYMEGAPEYGEIPVSMMVPDVGGTLNLRHPDACQALTDAAAGAGANVLRGVSEIKLGGDQPMAVSFTQGEGRRDIRAGLVVGADGRNSTVRKQAGIELQKDAPINYLAGLLLDDLDGVPDEFDVVVGEGDVMFVLFHQGNGRARAYFAVPKSGQHWFSGANSTENFLAATALASFPWSDKVGNATPAGPCATYPGDDTWTDRPFAEGVVLIGDAGGYNDPIIGEGLSIAMRDVRSVRDLILGGARTPEAFVPYGQERVERMRRLRFLADVMAVAMVEDAPNRAARRAWFGMRLASMDPEIFPLMVAAFAGPENLAPDAIDPALLDRIRAA